MSSWIVFKRFHSEVEGRVVESFLRAQGFEVQLLDTHAPTNRALPDRLGALRLMVRREDADAIEGVLLQNQKGTHLTVVSEDHEPEPSRPKRDRWVVAAVLALLLGTYFLTKLLS